MQELLLNNAERNCLYEVSGIDTEFLSVSRRLSELGFVKGTKVKVIQFSALKKTMLLELRGYTLSLRASIATMVKVVRV